VPWIYVVISGVLEIGWIFSLKFTDGFTRLAPSVCYALTGIGAAYFLSIALRSLPIGITYSVWMGIAISGSTVISMLIGHEPVRMPSLFFIALILCGIVGLQLSAPRL
jgi:quaternary ammonium compound-resistance protein SugE